MFYVSVLCVCLQACGGKAGSLPYILFFGNLGFETESLTGLKLTNKP